MNEHDANEQRYRNGYADGKRDAVKHGWWVESEYDFHCSVCGVYQNLYTGRTNYCPNCGAKMDGDVNG